MAAPTRTEAEHRANEVPGNRLSALIYDPILWWAERAGMSEHRRRLIAQARGDVLELGAGTGLNLPHYPATIDSLVVTEPQSDMAERLRSRLASLDRDAEVVRAPAGALPFDDESFDTVVVTLALCTVPEPGEALTEARRVLRPDGALLFLEHVRSEQPGLARWQDRLHGPWKAFADGCNCNRDVVAHIEDAGFAVVSSEHERWRRMPPIVQPLVSGVARPG